MGKPARKHAEDVVGIDHWSDSRVVTLVDSLVAYCELEA